VKNKQAHVCLLEQMPKIVLERSLKTKNVWKINKLTFAYWSKCVTFFSMKIIHGYQLIIITMIIKDCF